MASSIQRMIGELGRNVEALAGSKVRDKVMEGSQALGHRAKGPKTAQWVKGAMDRLDKLMDKKTRTAIMDRCGVHCAKFNSRVIQSALTRRRKFPALEAFVEAEIQKPVTGTTLERQGRSLILTYTPRSFTRPMRCYCALVNALPAKEQISPTYCYCSGAFVRTWWEAVLGQPVKVDILETALTGSDRCRFRIRTR